MNLIEQICMAREYAPQLLRYVRELLEYEWQSGYADATELWLFAYDDNDNVVGLERISEFL